MKKIILWAMLIAFVVAVAWPILATVARRRNLVDAVNIGEGTHAEKLTLTINSAVSAGVHHLLVKLTSATAAHNSSRRHVVVLLVAARGGRRRRPRPRRGG